MEKPIAVSEEKMEKKIEGMYEYEVKDCLRTLRRAEEIKKDAKKMKAIKKMFPEYMREEKKEISSLEELRKIIEGEE
jgi:16S rRNA C967 or C1407 C5-methylase (RsmB/RsmF family)